MNERIDATFLNVYSTREKGRTVLKWHDTVKRFGE